MERNDSSGLAVFVSTTPLIEGGNCVLGEFEARHIKVRRLATGAVIGLRDGNGSIATGTLVKLSKNSAHIDVISVEYQVPPPELHLLVPISDRDRMLSLAEKATELACTSWRPVLWKRSKSVSPRGEGITFQQKVRARMTSALAQSQGAWMPQLFPEANVERAVAASPEGRRFVLHPGARPFASLEPTEFRSPVTIAVGPEGGFEEDELQALHAGGFESVGLGSNILRFETAAIVAMGVVRSSY